MVDRREFVGMLAACAFTASVPAHAQPAHKVWRLGVIRTGPKPATPTPDQLRMRAVFADAMRKLGYVEGRDYVIERRYADGHIDRLPALVADLLRLDVDVLLVASTPAVRAAMAATTRIPIVMTSANDPVGAGLVASYAHPGGNVTGIAESPFGPMVVKRLELLKAIAPDVRRIAWLQSPFGGDDPTRPSPEVDAAAKALGVSLLRVPLPAPHYFDSATATVVREQADGLMVNPNPPNFIVRTELAEFALKRNLPTVGGTYEAAAAGILVAYYTDTMRPFADVAVYLDKIFKGASPRDLPVEEHSKFIVAVNLKTAKALRLTVPPSVLLRADVVLQ